MPRAGLPSAACEHPAAHTPAPPGSVASGVCAQHLGWRAACGLGPRDRHRPAQNQCQLQCAHNAPLTCPSTSHTTGAVLPAAGGVEAEAQPRASGQRGSTSQRQQLAHQPAAHPGAPSPAPQTCCYPTPVAARCCVPGCLLAWVLVGVGSCPCSHPACLAQGLAHKLVKARRELDLELASFSREAQQLAEVSAHGHDTPQQSSTSPASPDARACSPSSHTADAPLPGGGDAQGAGHPAARPVRGEQQRGQPRRVRDLLPECDSPGGGGAPTRGGCVPPAPGACTRSFPPSLNPPAPHAQAASLASL